MSYNPFSKAVKFAGHQFDFFADRAIYWPLAEALIVADVHIGKAASFRAGGVPVPSGSTDKDLGRLSILLDHTRAKRLIVVGDFLHAVESHVCMDRVALWRGRHRDVSMELVIGNHDRKAGALADELCVRHIDGSFEDHGITFVHDPDHADPTKPSIAGHVHPQVTLSDFDGSGVKVPCFVIDPALLILPSFGTFTGGYCLPNAPGRRRFIAAAGRVVELPNPAAPCPSTVPASVPLSGAAALAAATEADGTGKKTPAVRSPVPPAAGRPRARRF